MRALVYPFVSVCVFWVTVFLSFIFLAPRSVFFSDALAMTGVGVPNPALWDISVFRSGGAHPLSLSLTSFIAVLGFSLVVGGTAYFVGLYHDAHAQNRVAESRVSP